MDSESGPICIGLHSLLCTSIVFNQHGIFYLFIYTLQTLFDQTVHYQSEKNLTQSRVMAIDQIAYFQLSQCFPYVIILLGRPQNTNKPNNVHLLKILLGTTPRMQYNNNDNRPNTSNNLIRQEIAQG